MRRSDLGVAVRLFPIRLGPWLQCRAQLRHYRVLSADQVAARRRSDTVFVFGSGSSLNDLTDDDWTAIAEHDTLGFNWFVHQRFVRCDYHLIRGIPDTDLDASVWRRQLDEYFSLIRSNPCFEQTIFLVHGGFRAINGNRAIGRRYLPEQNPIFRWKTNVHDQLPSPAFSRGLVHGQSTLQECVNFGFLAGWRRIVLAGVDLYDRRYFWLPPDETRSVDARRGATAVDPHTQATAGLVETLATWRRWLERAGVELSVLNPRSLLAAELPVHRLGESQPMRRELTSS
jgi:hypothetical protein